MDPRIAPLAEMLRLNTRLFQNCLAGLSDQKARTRPTDSTNCAAFVAAHLVDSRYYLLHILGAKETTPLTGAEGGFNNINKVQSYPTLAEIRTAWTDAGKALGERLGKLTKTKLDAPLDPGFPVESKTIIGVLVFLVQHEGYHLGQLGLLRKQAGLPAMAYD
jgi:uncharacterized damage-inducible protein DinB